MGRIHIFYCFEQGCKEKRVEIISTNYPMSSKTYTKSGRWERLMKFAVLMGHITLLLSCMIQSGTVSTTFFLYILGYIMSSSRVMEKLLMSCLYVVSILMNLSCQLLNPNLPSSFHVWCSKIALSQLSVQNLGDISVAAVFKSSVLRVLYLNSSQRYTWKQECHFCHWRYAQPRGQLYTCYPASSGGREQIPT